MIGVSTLFLEHGSSDKRTRNQDSDAFHGISGVLTKDGMERGLCLQRLYWCSWDFYGRVSGLFSSPSFHYFFSLLLRHGFNHVCVRVYSIDRN